MERMIAISIADFTEKIHFLTCLPHIEVESILKCSKPVYKMIVANQIQDYLQKNCDFRIINTSLNSHTKAKITIMGDIIILLIYEAQSESNLIAISNNRLVESLNALTKAKRIKIEYLLKKFYETVALLYDTLYSLDPRLRTNNKNEFSGMKDLINVSKFR
jgi:hypothetical protein